MPFKRNITHPDALNFWQYTWKGEPVFIRLAWNGAALISDLSVLRDGVNASAAHRLFCSAFLQVLDSTSVRQRQLEANKGASDFHGFEHMQISTVECGLRPAEKCNIGEDFPDRAFWYTCPKSH